MKAFFKEVGDIIRDRANWPDLVVGTGLVFVLFTAVVVVTSMLHTLVGGLAGVWIAMLAQAAIAFFVTAVVIGPVEDDPTDGTNGHEL